MSQKLLLCGLILLLSVTEAAASDRCRGYSQDVRRAHFAQFGIDYPWWYGVAQLQKESNCRDIISRDGIGSEGPAQITYRWWAEALAKQGIPEVRTRQNHLRAQAAIMSDAWNASRGKLWVAYQIYNGGRLVLKEIDRAGAMDHAAARAQCKRRIIQFDNGQRIDACEINYGYSRRIYELGNAYRIGDEGQHGRQRFSYW